MKLLVVFATVFLVVSALTDQEQWIAFKAKHNKTYKNLKEEQLRFKIFQNNLNIIETHNAKYESGEESYFLGVNKFADLTNEEFRKIYLSGVQPPKPKSNQIFVRAANATSVPDSIDWRDQGAVLEVKNQDQCGSCWAFSTTGVLEGQNAIKHGKKISLSEQELVDCSGKYGNQGCNGGLMDLGFEYVKDNGISTGASYAYTGKDGTCKKGRSSGIKVTGYTDVHNSESSLKDAVELNSTWYQMDGAPPHRSRYVSNILNERFEDRWIANNGPFLWPPRSPDCTPLDYFIWGYVNNLVYSDPIRTKDDMQLRVRTVFNEMIPEMIWKSTHDNFLKRINLCLQQRGDAFEYLIK